MKCRNGCGNHGADVHPDLCCTCFSVAFGSAEHKELCGSDNAYDAYLANERHETDMFAQNGIRITDSIAECLAAHGFHLRNTGGNCTAFIREDGETEEIITMENDPSAPENLADAVAVGTCYVGGEMETVRGYTLADILAALANPSDEYFLLGLRLWNGFHRSAV